MIGILCGCYFWIFAKEKIPAYYDQNKVTAYSDGVFRMNLVGTSINNSNWKYILQVGRIWSVVCMIALPLLYFLFKLYLSDIVGRTGEYVLIAVLVAGLFIPMHVVAKNMNKAYGTRRKTGVFLRCKINLRKFQSDLLAIFFRDKYNKTIKYR